MQETSSSLRSAVKNIATFSARDRVDHFHFGLGTIVTISKHYTTIEFDDSGTRKFVTGIVKLAPSDTPRPRRRRRMAKKKI